MGLAGKLAYPNHTPKKWFGRTGRVLAYRWLFFTINKIHNQRKP